MNELSLEKTMSISEVAYVFEKDPSTIRKIAKALFPELFRNGVKTRLNEKHVTAIKLNLGKNSELQKTDLEKELLIQQAMMFQAEKVNKLQLQLQQKTLLIEEMRPKSDFYDQVTGSKDAIDIGSASKVLNMGIGRNNLFSFLRENKIFQENNQPYQRYIDAGYFRTIEQKFTKPDGSTNINIKTVVYQKGLDFIRRRLESK